MSKQAMSQSPVLRRRETVVSYLFLLPALFFFVCFVVTPMAMGVVTSLTDSHMGGGSFVGLKNYVDLFQDPVFLKSMVNTVIIVVVSVPVVTVFSLWVGSAIYEMRASARSFFRCVFYLPVVTGSVAVVVVWRWMFHTYNGLFNHLLTGAGILDRGFSFLGDPRTALVCVAVLTAWLNSGINFLYFSAGLGNIDESIYERASVDGANSVQKFFRLTLPGLSPIMFYTLVVNIIQAFQSFGQVKILTQGGPGESTNLIVYSIYRDAFFNYKFGSAAAQSVILFLIIMALTLVMFKIEKKGVKY